MTKRFDVCIDCRCYLHIFGRNRCQKCYSAWYIRQPHVRDRRAKQEQERRRANPERYQKYEDRRKKTTKRKAWRKAYNKEYYQKNAEKLKSYQSLWRKKNPHKREEFKRRYRARKALCDDSLTQEEWEMLLFVFDYSCAYCGMQETKLDKEHWIPASLGGGYSIDNIVPSCSHCNSRKNVMTGDVFCDLLDREEGVGLYV